MDTTTGTTRPTLWLVECDELPAGVCAEHPGGPSVHRLRETWDDAPKVIVYNAPRDVSPTGIAELNLPVGKCDRCYQAMFT